MSNQLLILTIIAFLALIYYKDQLPENYLIAGIIAVIILLIMSTSYGQSDGIENFDSNTNSSDGSDLSGREVRYGDVINLWGWNNAFLRFNGNGYIDAGPRLSRPEEIPRVGWTWEFMILEDPNEVALGFNNNNNPLKYGDKIMIRSTYKVGYFGINPSGNDQTVSSTATRNEWAQFQLISTDTSAKGGQTVKYGDQLYLKSNKGTFISVGDDSQVRHLSTQDNKALLVITDRYGQGGIIDWARRGTATQSSIYGNFLPNNSIDGNILTFGHTQNDDNSWWQVMLPRDVYINTINIVNRRDCCQDRLTNFDVIILDQNNNIITTKYYETAGAGITWSNINQIGRIVKVQLRKKNYLHMAEVNVLGAAVNYSLLLEKPLSADVLNEPKTYSSAKAPDDPTNTMTVNSVDLPYNNRSKDVAVTMFIKILKTNPNETSIIHKGNSDTEKSPAITLLPNSSRLRMYYGTTQSASQYFDDSDNLPLNQWIHITYVIDGGINDSTGWQLGSFQAKLPQPPYEQCCYYINPLLKQYYYLPLNLSPNTAKSNVWDPSTIEGMTYMGQLDPKMMKPQAFLYINGIQKTSIELNDVPRLNSGPLNLGKSPTLTMTSSDFTIDQVKYFNYRLSQQQIVRLARFPLINITKSLVQQTPDARNIVKFEPNQLPHVENDFTVNFWLMTNRQPNGTGNWDQIFLKGNSSLERAPAMWFHPDSNALHMPIRTKNKANTWGEGIITSNYIFPLNEWHHVALTLKDKVQTLYIDSQQKNQMTLSDYPIYTISPLAVGGFTGQLYNFQFSNYAMTQEQVKIAMGQYPDEPYNAIIRQIWRDAGCLSNPIPDDQPNKYPEWKTLIKNDQKSRVEGIIRSIKKKADDGDKKTQEICYGKFTAGMLDQLAEREKLLQYTLEKQKDGTKCLPIAPFDCQQKSINDFDIRTHKDFNKYTLSTKIQKCNGDQNTTDNSDFTKIKKELEESKLMITKLQTLQQELQKQNTELEQNVRDTSTKSQLTQEQLMQYPAFAELKQKYDAQQQNLQQVTQQLKQQQSSVSQMQNTLNSGDLSQNSQYMKLFSDHEQCRKVAQANLANNLDLSQLKNNPLFMQTLAELKQNSMKPQQCTSDQIMNSREYQALKNQGANFSTELKKASQLSQQAVDELEKTRRMALEILKNLNHLNLDEGTAQKLLTSDVNDPSFKNLLNQIKNGQGQGQPGQKCIPGKIEDHPDYNQFMQKLNSGQSVPKHVRCWGCELPQSI